ncbi:MAG: NUDIX hydrolase [Oscillospiraceae bacterium]|jgi:ADP-ribose pyrophosphatase
MHLYERTLDCEIIHKGKIINVTRDTVELENGKTALREVVHHSGGVCVLPLTDENDVIFVRQFRYPFNDVLLEIPAGKLNEGEDPFECGKRELKEETGAVAAEYIFLGVMYPTTAYLTEKIHIYLAKGLDFSEQWLDEDEFLDVVRIPFERAVEMVLNNEIPDAKTQIAILKARLILMSAE